jgi:dipeptidyl aminopeptidase/acylaminoacyl peptidase
MHRRLITLATRLLGLSLLKTATMRIGSSVLIRSVLGFSSLVTSAKVVIYDLTKDARFILTEQWDRSPSEIHVIMGQYLQSSSADHKRQFSHDDRYLFLAVGEHARVKVFGVEVPATPKDPALNTVYTEPEALTESGAVSSVHPLKDGRLVFTRSSFTNPNEVFLLSPSDHSLFEGAKELQLTAFSERGLKDKHLDKGTELWWDGAKQKIQGWVLTPPGFQKGDNKKWPVVMVIHGKSQNIVASLSFSCS